MRLSFVAVAVAFAALSSMAQQTLDFDPSQSCTSIMVGRKATTDGSVITSHTCDGSYRSGLYVRPAKDYPNDTTVTVYTGRMFTDYIDDRGPLEARGTIPQAAHTYRYFDTAYPCMNEHQLAMGETTFGGKPEMRSDSGMFRIEELQRLALERCTTARDAIKLMGEMIEKYGYIDGGECLTIADPKEVWHFEVLGPGIDSIGGVWAAVRIPDDEVGVSANICRIPEVDTSDPSRCMASANVRDLARRMGLWDGKEPFSFWRAYGTNYAHPKEPKSFDIREYYILNALAPSLHLDFEAEELPLSVKPDKKVSVEDVLALYRQTYEGSDFNPIRALRVAEKHKDGTVDTIISPRANPWLTKDEKTLYSALHGSKVGRERPVPVAFCSYGTVIQCRDWLPDDLGGVIWMSFDNPAQSPRIPIYAGTTQLPTSMGINGNRHYLPDAAIWHFRTPNKLSALKWGRSRKAFEDGIRHFEQKGLSEQPFVKDQYEAILKADGQDAARQWLNGYTADFLGAAQMRWDDLSRRLTFEGKNGL